MTKEEILNKRVVSINCGDYWDSEIFIAMEEYAKQEAIGFHAWACKNMYIRYWGSDTPNRDKWYKSYTMPSRDYYTDEELYELYLQSKK